MSKPFSKQWHYNRLHLQFPLRNISDAYRKNCRESLASLRWGREKPRSKSKSNNLKMAISSMYLSQIGEVSSVTMECCGDIIYVKKNS